MLSEVFNFILFYLFSNAIISSRSMIHYLVSENVILIKIEFVHVFKSFLYFFHLCRAWQQQKILLYNIAFCINNEFTNNAWRTSDFIFEVSIRIYIFRNPENLKYPSRAAKNLFDFRKSIRLFSDSALHKNYRWYQMWFDRLHIQRGFP